MRTSLPVHEWDDDAHRQAIHKAFDEWFLSHEQTNARAQAANRKRQLEKLIQDAALRKTVQEFHATQVQVKKAPRRRETPSATLTLVQLMEAHAQ